MAILGFRRLIPIPTNEPEKATLEECFVLVPAKDPAARTALRAYAVSVKEANPVLALEVYDLLHKVTKV